MNKASRRKTLRRPTIFISAVFITTYYNGRMGGVAKVSELLTQSQLRMAIRTKSYDKIIITNSYLQAAYNHKTPANRSVHFFGICSAKKALENCALAKTTEKNIKN